MKIKKILLFSLFWGGLFTCLGLAGSRCFSGHISHFAMWFLPYWSSPRYIDPEGILYWTLRVALSWVGWILVLSIPLLSVKAVMHIYKKTKTLMIPDSIYFIFACIFLTGLGMILISIGGWSSCGPTKIISKSGGWLTVSHAVFWEYFGIYAFHSAILNIIYLFFISIFDWFILLYSGWRIFGVLSIYIEHMKDK